MEAGKTTRRSFLKKGLALLLGGAGLHMAKGSAAAVSKPAAPIEEGALKLYGRHWHAYSQARRPGQLPTRGDRLAVYGELLDAPEGAKVGEFYATTFCMTAPFGASPVAAMAIELHTFVLSDGTLMGMGTTSSASAAENVYAVVGGTGRYAGARGSYIARQQPQELEGDGAAEFALHLTALETI